MSWIPTVIALIAAGVMTLYPLNQKKMDEITIELNKHKMTSLQTENILTTYKFCQHL